MLPTIDPEFARLIPPLSPDEFAQLEANIVRDGCREPLAVWAGHGVLLDGHNRLRICQAHGLPFAVVEVELSSRDDAEDWIDRNQLGRRNLSPDQASLLRGRRYNRTKKLQGGDHGNQYVAKDQNDTLPTADRLAVEHGVSAPTIKRDGQYAAAVEKAAALDPDLPRKVATGEAPPKSAVIRAAKLLDEQPALAASILAGDTDLKQAPHVSHNSGAFEWYTPPEFIAAARAVMGDIDLDPASSEIANQIVCAKKFYTAEDDGLIQEWRGRAYMNPPYSGDLVGLFARKFVGHFVAGDITEGIVLVNNATETAWFYELVSSAQAICFTRSRVKYLDENLVPRGAPLQGQALIYFGPNARKFIMEYSGLCWGAVL